MAKNYRMGSSLSVIIVESFLQELTNKKRHIESCSGVPRMIYNFNNKNLITFEDNQKDICPWQYILTLKQLLQPTTVSIQNKKNVCYVLCFDCCFSPVPEL